MSGSDVIVRVYFQGNFYYLSGDDIVSLIALADEVALGAYPDSYCQSLLETLQARARAVLERVKKE
jgi:hypothetical protein